MVKISIRNLSFAYRKENVLKNLSLDFETGRLSMILGPNGSGKSTLLKCINGILKTATGTISVNGEDVQHLSRNKKARLMTYVPQQENQVFSGTVYETVLMGRKPYIGWSPGRKDHVIVNRVIKDLDLEQISGEYLNELSGGQRQRVIIGRALAQQPEVLLLDEPTANLDLKHQLEVMQLLKSLTARQITVIIAIHDLNLASAYADRLILLDDGQLFAGGDQDILGSENIKKLYQVEVEVLSHKNQQIIIPVKPVKKD